MEVTVRIRRLHDHVRLPQYQTAGAAGFDLAASADVTIEPHSIALIPTGLVIEVPPGQFLGIFARSSTPIKRGLMVANGVGVIDCDYCGDSDEIKVQVLNFTDQRVVVRGGDRIAQGLLIPVTRAHWVETSGPLRDGSRGGFGATGER
ncbi:MAG TPA: dUTP diphosphatase [Vicinamibacterales bacterium]|jgi:dUTP pyrophosphatase|nr:dUTP diphosphatase [Vicinamibacterales bacterium]